MVRKIKLLGFFLIILGFSIPIGYSTTNKVITQINNQELTAKIPTNNYYAILAIPKINLKREIFALDSKENNVNHNLMLHEESIMPDNLNSNVIILGHSGWGINAYFQNLYRLNIGDEVILYYNKQKFTYEITEIETQTKTGKLYLKVPNAENITLITCTKNNHQTQTIYYGKLKNKENNV